MSDLNRFPPGTKVKTEHPNIYGSQPKPILTGVVLVNVDNYLNQVLIGFPNWSGGGGSDTFRGDWRKIHHDFLKKHPEGSIHWVYSKRLKRVEDHFLSD